MATQRAQVANEAEVHPEYTGFNIDWEPTDPANATDASAFAAVLDQMAQALHALSPPRQLSVCVAVRPEELVATHGEGVCA